MRTKFHTITITGAPRRCAYGPILAICLVPISASVCMGQGHGPTKVEVLPVEQRDVAPTIELVGTVRPNRRAIVASEISGLVIELKVDDGDRISKGDLLCRLRDTPRQLAHAQALSRLDELNALRQERDAELDRTNFEKARTENLWNLQQSTEKEYKDALSDYAAAKGRADQAEHGWKAQQSMVAMLADELSRTEVRAPFDGFITARHIEVGEWVDQGDDIVSILDLTRVRVRVNVPEASIAYCQVGEDALVRVDALDDSMKGTVSRIIPDADQQARTFPVEVDIENPETRLKAGMFVRASVPAGPRRTCIVVPKDAVLLQGALTIVYVVREREGAQMAEIAPVRVTAEVYDYVALEAPDLKPGDLVIVRGNDYMRGPGPVVAVARKQGELPSARMLDAAREQPKAAGAPAEPQTPKRDSP